MSLKERLDSAGWTLPLVLRAVVALHSLGWPTLGLAGADDGWPAPSPGLTERERRVVQLEQARAGAGLDHFSGAPCAASSGATWKTTATPGPADHGRDGLGARRADLPDRPRRDPWPRPVAHALANTKDTLTELRDLVRGILRRYRTRPESERCARAHIWVVAVVDIHVLADYDLSYRRRRRRAALTDVGALVFSQWVERVTPQNYWREIRRRRRSCSRIGSPISPSSTPPCAASRHRCTRLILEAVRQLIGGRHQATVLDRLIHANARCWS